MRVIYRYDPPLRVADFAAGPRVLTIRSVACVPPMVVVSFAELACSLRSSQSNLWALAYLLGRNTDAWVGRRVKVGAVPVEDGGELAVRVLAAADIPEGDQSARCHACGEAVSS